MLALIPVKYTCGLEKRSEVSKCNVSFAPSPTAARGVSNQVSPFTITGSSCL